jgi:peptidoglycan/xylan/chitin deacetylase (PgdA/CDA1 family)
MLEEMRQKLAGKREGLGDRVMMSWDELREMKRGGMLIGSHTVSHPLLPGISVKEAAREIAESKSKIEEELDDSVFHFAYPNPGGSVHVNEEVKALVRHAGYQTARRVFKAGVDHQSDLFELNGINVGRSSNHPALLAWLLK